jgi:hypothetical protein
MRCPGSSRARLRGLATLLVAGLAAASFDSCSAAGEIAAVWTDVPELAIAAELFNSRGGPAAVRVAWKRDLAESVLALKATESKAAPALLVGRRLGGAELRDRLSSVDFLLKRESDRDSFYPQLLAGGVIGGKRVLLPLSFNLPAIAFLRGSPAAGDGFTLSLEDIAAPSAAYRRPEGGSGARMGFSPRWDARFFLAALDSGGARFGGVYREVDSPGRSRAELGWDPQGLTAALTELGLWSARVNGSAALEDDFRFKHLFSPPYRWLKEGKTLYAHMDSSELFLVSEEKRAELDFRWYSSDGRVPISEGAVYAGLVRRSSGSAAAQAFLRWLLTPEAQRAVLERSRESSASNYSFGVAGGFSSIRSVNEGVFPSFYPALVGHAPPADKLAEPARLPLDWPSLKTAVLIPWALEASSRAPGASRGNPGDELAARIADYRKRGVRQ